MEIIRLLSQAKINLFLNITGVRPDGYHEIETVMQSISLADRIKLAQLEKGIGLYCDLPYVPRDERNIAYKAARLFFERTGVSGGVYITLRKRIPVGAGLAGGSGNAAAVLVGLNELYRTGLSKGELCEMGLALGADVPFCITGGTQLATGIGERLTPLPAPPPLKLLLAKPRRSISTPVVYQHYDKMTATKEKRSAQHAPVERGPLPAHRSAATQRTAREESVRHPADLTAFQKGLERGNPVPYFANVLEPVTGALCPEVPALIDLMERYGARAMMSGSGTAVFGVFRDDGRMNACKRRIRERFREVFVVRAEPVEYGVRLK